MSNKPKTEYRVGVGASSILMVLVVLALTAVSLLSFQSARNADVLTKRNLQMTLAYYQASAKAQEKLAGMDALLAEILEDSGIPTEEDLAGHAEQLEMEEFEVWLEGEGMTFSFVEDAGYQRRLEVGGILAEDDGMRFQITKYMLTSDPEEYDGALQFQLIGG